MFANVDESGGENEMQDVAEIGKVPGLQTFEQQFQLRKMEMEQEMEMTRLRDREREREFLREKIEIERQLQEQGVLVLKEILSGLLIVID